MAMHSFIYSQSREREMKRCNSFLRSPKKEEQQVPDTVTGTAVSSENTDVYLERSAKDEIDNMEDLEGIWGIEDEEKFLEQNMCDKLEWDFMEWEEFGIEEDRQFKEVDNEEDEEDHEMKKIREHLVEQSYYSNNNITVRENPRFGEDEDEEKTLSLNLSLNYQEVLDAWSDRGSLWAGDYSLSMANTSFMGEVPVMEEERIRREARVLRYKEKRQTRLFSKKIRYQVRKLNAEKRPRLKGRFVKRAPDKILR